MLAIGTLIVRALAIYLFVQGTVLALPYLQDFGKSSEYDSIIVVGVISAALLVLLSMLLWLFASNIAKKMGNFPPESSLQASEVQIVSAGSFLIGLFFIIFNIYPFIVAVYYAMKCQPSFDCSSLQIREFIHGLSAATGIFLLLGNKFICSLFHAIKRFGG